MSADAEYRTGTEPRGIPAETPTGDRRTWYPRAALVAGLLSLAMLYSVLLLIDPSRFGLLVCFGGIASAAVFLGLRNPVLATMYLLAATFLRLAIPSGTFPVDPFLPAFVGVVLSTLIWSRVRGNQAPVLGPIEVAMGLYVLWNVVSLLTPHVYEAGEPLSPTPFSVSRFLFIGIFMPLAMFVIGRAIFDEERALRPLLWALLSAGAYSAVVSIAQFHGPTWLVWPRYILEAPGWENRAVGVFNQPVVNGLVLIVGFVVANLIAAHASERLVVRFLATGVGVASIYAIYLTHTRAVWLAFVLVIVIGCVGAVGFRKGYVLSLAAVLTAVALNWPSFTSADRGAGGVASPGELQDRLNLLATSIWAIEREPLTGWGIGRFPVVNTFHHQAWSPAIPWERGYGIPSHLDVLGILTELGVIGLALWVTVLVLVGTELVRAVRRLPIDGVGNRPFAITAAMSFFALLITGLTVDLRFFDFPNIVVWLLVGASIGRFRNIEYLQSVSQSVSQPASPLVASTSRSHAPSGQVGQ